MVWGPGIDAAGAEVMGWCGVLEGSRGHFVFTRGVGNW